MTQYAQWADPAQITAKVLQSSEASDLQNQINRYIASLDGATTIITAITLAGAGDGFTFVALIETVPGTNSGGTFTGGSSGGLLPTLLGTQFTQVRCYLAATADALVQVKSGIVPPPVGDGPSVVVDEQLAGAAKGTRFMGMSVYIGASAPTNLFEAGCIFPVHPVTGLITATVLSFDAAILSKNFSLPAAQTIRYDGAGAFVGKFDANLAVHLTAGAPPAFFSAEFLLDPLGTPTPFGTLDGSVDVALGSEDVALIGFKGVAPGNLFGLRFNVPGGTFSILSGYIRITP